jgi:hypothetical protein
MGYISYMDFNKKVRPHLHFTQGLKFLKTPLISCYIYLFDFCAKVWCWSEVATQQLINSPVRHVGSADVPETFVHLFLVDDDLTLPVHFHNSIFHRRQEPLSSRFTYVL